MMDKEIWKWLFDHMFDEELIRLTRVAKIRLDGFRDINAKSIKLIRPKLIQSFLQKKHLNKLRKTIFISLSKEKFEHTASKEEYMNEIFNDFLSIVHLLLMFLSSDDREKYKKGVDLYYEFKEKGYLQACEQKFSLIKLHKEALNRLEDMRNNYAELEKNYQTESKTVEAIYEENKRFKSKNKQLQNEIKYLKSKILESQERMNQLIEQTIPKICIIGKITDDPFGSIGNPKRIEIVENIEQIPIEKLNHYNEIWMLSYDIPFPARRKISQRFPQKEVKQFDTYIEMKNHIKTFLKGCHHHAQDWGCGSNRNDRFS